MKTLKAEAIANDDGSNQQISPANYSVEDAKITIPADIRMKRCTKCKEVKPFNEFYKNRARKDGLFGQCKTCEYESQRTRNRARVGRAKAIFDWQVGSSKDREHPPPTYSKKEFVEFAINHPQYKAVYDAWRESGFEDGLTVTFDRADNSRGYSFDNFKRFIDWKTHNYEANQDRKNGIDNRVNKAVISMDRITAERRYFHSIMEAERATGIDNSNISKCCNGKAKSAGGCTWHFASKIIQVSRIINLGRKLIKQVA